MSYYKVKSVSFNKKKNKIFVTAACNNLRPLCYERCEYGKDEPFEEKLLDFWVSVMEGNFQFLNSCKYVNDANILYSMYNTEDKLANFFENDYKLRLNWARKVREACVKLLIFPRYDIGVKDKENCPSIYRNQAIDDYRIKESALRKEGYVFISAAAWFRPMPEYDVLIESERNRLVIAKKENYDSAGRLFDPERKALYLSPNTAQFFRTFNCCESLEDKYGKEIKRLFPQVIEFFAA